MAKTKSKTTTKKIAAPKQTKKGKLLDFATPEETPAKKEKLGRWQKMLDDAKAGKRPKKPRITSASRQNLSYQRHIDELDKAAKEPNINFVANFPIAGTNTYAKQVRAFKEALVAYLEHDVGK